MPIQRIQRKPSVGKHRGMRQSRNFLSGDNALLYKALSRARDWDIACKPDYMKSLGCFPLKLPFSPSLTIQRIT